MMADDKLRDRVDSFSLMQDNQRTYSGQNGAVAPQRKETVFNQRDWCDEVTET